LSGDKRDMPGDSDPHRQAAREAWRLMFDTLIETAGRRQESLGRRGLTPNDSRALFTLDGQRGQAIGALARRWNCDPSTATWVVDRLERAGLAERRPSPRDRRVKLVVLTEKGAQTMADMLAEFHEPPDLVMRLSTDELETLRALLEQMRGDASSDTLINPTS
jgi:DNA-binding MarR family transcriptional regulator